MAGEVGELAGVSGNTIGQWARRGLIRSSQSDGEPRVYSIEDINEATVVAELLARGVRHVDVHRASERLAEKYGACRSRTRTSSTGGGAAISCQPRGTSS